MKKPLFLIGFLLIACFTFAQKGKQKKPVFNRNYARAGISFLGNSINTNLNPEANIIAGNFGTNSGYVLDIGYCYYFRKRTKQYKFNAGIDWTMLSFSYNRMKQWKDYGPGYDKGKAFDNVAAYAATKAGPFIAYNPVKKLVMELRFQMSYVLRINNFTYDDYNRTTGESIEYFSFNNQQVRTGFAPNAGFTLRYGLIGVGLDYMKTNFSTPYEAKHPNQSSKISEAKIPVNNLQLKVNFAF